MKPKHTEGPWLVTGIQGSDRLMVGAGDGSDVVCDIRVDRPDAEANAKLIAMAPTMLSSLRLMCHALQWHIREHGYVASDSEILRQAQLIIDRATK